MPVVRGVGLGGGGGRGREEEGERVVVVVVGGRGRGCVCSPATRKHAYPDRCGRLGVKQQNCQN